MDHYPERTSDFGKTFTAKFQLLPGYTGLYLSAAFRDLGMSLIGLFIPLYVLRLTGNLSAIFLFYAFYHFVVVFFDYPVALMVKYLGIDLVGLSGALARAGFVVLLMKAESNSAFLWWAALGWGLAVALTWLPFHYAFTVAEKEDGKYGKEVSRLEIVYKTTGLIGPAAGGLMISFLGFKSLFSMALVLIIISGLPLLLDTLRGKDMRLSLGKIAQHLTAKKRRKFWFSLAGGELESVVLGLIWPLFIFLVVKDYEILGLIKSGAMLVSIAVVWFLGKWIDRRGKSVLHLGTVINSFNVLLRPFLVNPFALFLIDSAYAVTNNFIITPFQSAFYEQAIKMRKLEFMVEREFIIHFAGTLICLLLALILVFQISWFWFFALGVVGILLRNYILAAENEE